MLQAIFQTACPAILWLAIAAAGLASAEDRTIPKPLPDHPGNVFLAGEEVAIRLPDRSEDAWRCVDYDGQVVAQGRGAGAVHLGRLPVGYYEVRRDRNRSTLPQRDSNDATPTGNAPRSFSSSVAVAVLAPLKTPTPETSPIECDVAMASTYPKAKMPAVANLCALAGMNWVRDRFVWRELEPIRDRFIAKCLHDDSAAIQAAAGLKILQVNHSGPLWSWERRRTPSDLRDAYRFYREAARRWKGKVLAFEPWNEADIVDDSGQTGSEMASMQKATYLGLKAGNPQVIAGTIPFAGRTPVTLIDYHANQAWPYFDTCNFHVYRDFDEWPATCAPFRDVSAGRPMWITELNVPLPWPGMQRFRPPTAGDEAAQAERVAKLYAVALHEGAAAAFYFVLPHFIERNMDHGLLRTDLTARPAYVALAAVGRLLADAHPLGKLRTDHPRLRGFIFRAQPDGTEHVVVVAWATDRAETLELPVTPIATYDVLGRPLPTSDTIELSTAPVIMVFGPDAAKLRMEPPPAAPQWLKGQPSPVVLQVVVSKQRIVWQESAYSVGRGEFDRIPIYVYNFGPEKVEGRLTVKGPKDWNLRLPQPVQAAPGDRIGVGVTLDVPKAAAGVQTITVEGDFRSAGKAVLSFRLLPEAR